MTVLKVDGGREILGSCLFHECGRSLFSDACGDLCSHTAVLITGGTLQNLLGAVSSSSLQGPPSPWHGIRVSLQLRNACECGGLEGSNGKCMLISMQETHRPRFQNVVKPMGVLWYPVNTGALTSHGKSTALKSTQCKIF